MYKNIFLGLLSATAFASASNGFKSELSHFIGGLVLAMLVAFLVDKYSSKYKAKSVFIGFWASVLYVTVDQSLDYIIYGKFLDQLLDFSVHFLGAALGAFLIILYLRKISTNNS